MAHSRWVFGWGLDARAQVVVRGRVSAQHTWRDVSEARPSVYTSCHELPNEDAVPADWVARSVWRSAACISNEKDEQQQLACAEHE